MSACCRANLGAGQWLGWVYRRLSDLGGAYDEHMLLYEVVASTLAAEVVVFTSSDGITRVNVVDAHADLEQTVEVWKGVGAGQGGGLPVEVRPPPRLPVAISRLRRYELTSQGRRLLLFFCEESGPPLCDKCSNQVQLFLNEPTAPVRPPVGDQMLTAPPVRTPRIAATGDSEPIGDLLEQAQHTFLSTLLEQAQIFLSLDDQGEVDSLREHFSQFPFSVTAVLSNALLLSGDRARLDSQGYGYYLTGAQREHLAKVLGLSAEAGLARRAEMLLRGFAYGQQTDQEPGEGLVARVIEHRHPLWSRNLFAKQLYAHKPDRILVSGVITLLRDVTEREEVPKAVAALEDHAVHSPNADEAGRNFIFELPVYHVRAEKPRAAVFLVLPQRPSGRVLALLVLSARAAYQPCLEAIFDLGAPRIAASLRGQGWSPLLLHREVLDDALERAFPRATGDPHHNEEAIFDEDVGAEDIRKLLEGAGADDVFLAHSDSQSLFALATRHTRSPQAVKWAAFLLKMRVRAKQAGLMNRVYVLDLFHYLAGWSAFPNFAYRDLEEILGPTRKQWTKALRECDVALAVSPHPWAGDGSELTIAYKPKGKDALLWRQNRADNEFSCLALWDMDQTWWGNEAAGLRWLRRARVTLPLFRTNDPAGPLGVFLAKLSERVSEERPSCLNLILRHDVGRLVVEALWPTGRAPGPRPPDQLLPDAEGVRVEGGDVGHVRKAWTRPRSTDPGSYEGWFVALPVSYEGGGWPKPLPAEGLVVDAVILVNDDRTQLTQWRSVVLAAAPLTVIKIEANKDPATICADIRTLLDLVHNACLVIDIEWEGQGDAAGARLLTLLRADGRAEPALVLTEHYGQENWDLFSREHLPEPLHYHPSRFPDAYQDAVAKLRTLLEEVRPLNEQQVSIAKAAAQTLLRPEEAE